MKINSRTECIFCKKLLELQYTLSNTPISFSPTISPSSNIDSIDLRIGLCSNCHTLQLMDLIDPEILYSQSHNETFNTPSWKNHHNNFFLFCCEEIIINDKIIEVGGAQCILANKFYESNKNINYSILDLITDKRIPQYFKYINGNCETYKFEEDVLIMSHVFEHLHYPRTFLENIQKSPINKIFISVPDQEYLLQTNNLMLIHIEHTFFFTRHHIIDLFKVYGFILRKYRGFNNHSMFFYFERDANNNSNLENINIIDNRYKMITYLKNRENMINKLKNIVNPNEELWILPAGLYGSIIYENLKEKNKILGFLDNDKTKQGKYLSGSDILIYSLNIIKNISNPKIVLYAGPYEKELIENIILINPTAIIYTIN